MPTGSASVGRGSGNVSSTKARPIFFAGGVFPNGVINLQKVSLFLGEVAKDGLSLPQAENPPEY